MKSIRSALHSIIDKRMDGDYQTHYKHYLSTQSIIDGIILYNINLKNERKQNRTSLLLRPQVKFWAFGILAMVAYSRHSFQHACESSSYY